MQILTMDDVERLCKIISESSGTFSDILSCIEHEFHMETPLGVTKLALRRQLIHYENDVVLLNEELLNKYMTPFYFYEFYIYSPDSRINIIIHFGFNESYRKTIQNVFSGSGHSNSITKIANMMFNVIERFIRVNHIDTNEQTPLCQWFNDVNKAVHSKKRYPHTSIQHMSVYHTKHRHVIRTIGLLKGWGKEKMTNVVIRRQQHENEPRDEYIKRLPKF